MQGYLYKYAQILLLKYVTYVGIDSQGTEFGWRESKQQAIWHGEIFNNWHNF